MTKEQFIEYAEEKLGYANYKDLVVELGYGKRYLDRIKYEDKINEKFLEQLEKFKSKTKTDTKIEDKKEEKKVGKKKEVKKEPVKQAEDKREDGIGLIISNKEYHNSTKLGASKIKLILENAREYQARYITKEIENSKTDALIIGSLHHTLVLEPEMLDKEYVVVDMPSRPLKSDYVNAVEKLGGVLETKENSKGEIVITHTVEELKNKFAELKEAIDKTIVTQAQLELAQETSKKALDSWFIVEAGLKTLLKAQLRDVLALDNCYVERTFYGVIDGVEVQVRPDILVNLSKSGQFWFVIDLKTAQDATMSMFASQSAKFYYDIQEWIYREVLKQNGIIVKDFRFNVAGKSETSRSAYYQLHTEDVENAEKIVKKVIKKYKWCKENDIWEEGFFDYHRMRFDPTAVVQMPTWRQFEMIKMGVM